MNGARPRSNNYMLDGQDINDVGIGGQSFNAQVPDMYQTVTTLLNSSSAEYGRSGGAVINLVTRAERINSMGRPLNCIQDRA